MGDLGRKLLAAGLLLATVLLIAPTFASAIQIHAHRGGPNVDGVASFGENSMSAFSHSAAVGFVIEMDPVSYTHLRAHETVLDIVCRLLLGKKKPHNRKKTKHKYTTRKS